VIASGETPSQEEGAGDEGGSPETTREGRRGYETRSRYITTIYTFLYRESYPHRNPT
jgi:hypothetical protein